MVGTLVPKDHPYLNFGIFIQTSAKNMKLNKKAVEKDEWMTYL